VAQSVWLVDYLTVISFSDGRRKSTRREPLTMDKQLVNFITCSCKLSAPFFVNYKEKMKGGDTVAYVVCEVNISFPNGSSNL
jgi:hypothetical protein